MTRRATLSDAENRVLAHLRSTAEDGITCVTNMDIVRATGCEYSKTVQTIANLKLRGLITARHLGSHREITLHEPGGEVKPMTVSRPKGDTPNIKPARRTCLRCGIKFPSQGPHERMCKGCRGAAADVVDMGCW